MSPERRRRAVAHLQGRFRVSERRACRCARQYRSAQRYRRRCVADEALLRERLRLLARRHPRYGYRRVGERKHYYPADPGREDAIVMSYKL